MKIDEEKILLQKKLDDLTIEYGRKRDAICIEIGQLENNTKEYAKNKIIKMSEQLAVRSGLCPAYTEDYFNDLMEAKEIKKWLNILCSINSAE